MDINNYKKEFTSEDAVGWVAIDKALDKIYAKEEGRHYGPLCGIHFMAGGNDPIDGVTIYDAEKPSPHKHIVSYGMSQLYYDEESAGAEFSKWGFEFTMRIAPFEEDETDPLWAVGLMNNLARYVYQSGRWFEENQFIPANGPIRLNTKTNITGLICILDPDLGKISTPNGEVSFIQLVGITIKELEFLQQNPNQQSVKQLADELRKDNPKLITDLNRK